MTVQQIILDKIVKHKMSPTTLTREDVRDRIFLLNLNILNNEKKQMFSFVQSI